MSTENTNVFKKDNLDLYLKELAKEYKKPVGRNMPAEVILIGAAAVIENYGFRDMTTVIDAIISAASAMNLRAFRQHKNDLSDIIGVLAEHEKRGDPMTFERIEKAVTDLYVSWDDYPKGAKDFIVNALSSGNCEKVYDLVRQNEKDAKADLIDFEGKYPGALKTDNVEDVLQNLRARKRRDDPER